MKLTTSSLQRPVRCPSQTLLHSQRPLQPHPASSYITELQDAEKAEDLPPAWTPGRMLIPPCSGQVITLPTPGNWTPPPPQLGLHCEFLGTRIFSVLCPAPGPFSCLLALFQEASASPPTGPDSHLRPGPPTVRAPPSNTDSAGPPCPLNAASLSNST